MVRKRYGHGQLQDSPNGLCSQGIFLGGAAVCQGDIVIFGLVVAVRVLEMAREAPLGKVDGALFSADGTKFLRLRMGGRFQRGHMHEFRLARQLFGGFEFGYVDTRELVCPFCQTISCCLSACCSGATPRMLIEVHRRVLALGTTRDVYT